MESRKFLPSLYVRGTFYQVGYDVGETFKCMIEDYVQLSSYLSNQLLPAYNTRRGQLIYRDTLNLMKTKFPHYVRELQGIADGSQVPFHQLMLLHMDTMILAEGTHNQEHSGNGCSSIMCNQQDVILGHTEDALPPANHHCYVIHADITDSEAGVLRHEKFSALCYAGHLPGFCMNINTHGFVYSINVIEALRVHPDKTPRHFLTRALLTARNLEEAQLILRDSGCGSSHGFCVNMAFIHQEGPILFHSAEVGPAANGESQLSILTVSPGESHARYNKYLRLNIEEEDGCCVHSSNGRQRAVDRLGLPQTVNDVMDLLSNQDDPDYPIYRSGASKKDIAVTIATGIFDFRQKEWRLYVDRANSTPPIAVFPMEI